MEKFNPKRNDEQKTRGENRSKAEKLAIIVSIVTLISTILIIFVNTRTLNEIKLDDFIAKDLIEDYQDAYHYALEVKYQSNYDNETDEKKKIKIKNDMMSKFKEILNEDLCEEVEKSIFEWNQYDDIQEFQYKFDYIHTYKDETGEKYSLIVDDQYDTIELVDPYYYKINRENNEHSEPIYSDKRKYKVERKKSIIPWSKNKYILSKRIDK